MVSYLGLMELSFLYPQPSQLRSYPQCHCWQILSSVLSRSKLLNEWQMPMALLHKNMKYLTQSIVPKWNVKSFKYVVCSLLYIFLTGIKQLLQCKDNNWLQQQSQWNQRCRVQSICWEHICIRVNRRAANWLKYVFRSCETNCFIKLLAYWSPFFSICGALSSQSMLIMAPSQSCPLR